MRYIGRRLLSGLFTIWIIMTLTFIMMQNLPGDFFTNEKRLPEAVMLNIRARYHLNDPLLKQYLDYIGNAFQGNFGPSFRYATRSVNEIIDSGFPVSAELGGVALGLALLVGIPAGVISALHRNRGMDNLITFASTIGISQPSFIVATLLSYYVGVKLGWLPVAQWESSRWEHWQHVVMPALALSFFPAAYIARLVRSNMLEVAGHDFIRTARAKGLPRLTVVVKHALRNAVLPVLTILGPMAAAILTGSLVIEKIFYVPGLGGEFVTSILNRDYGVIMGLTIFYAFLIVSFNLVVDILYGIADPRIKLAGSKER